MITLTAMRTSRIVRNTLLQSVHSIINPTIVSTILLDLSKNNLLHVYEQSG